MSYVVTTSIEGISRTLVWDPRNPLGLGHPLRWVVEKTSKGVRARHLGAPDGQARTSGVQEVDQKALERGIEMDLGKLQLKIRAARPLMPAFRSDSGSELQVYTCIGPSITSSAAAAERFRGIANEKNIFELLKTGTGYRLSVLDPAAMIKGASASNSALDLSLDQLMQVSVHLGAHAWHFGRIAPAAESAAKTTAHEIDPETEWFKRALRYAAVGCVAFGLMSWLWPKPQVSQELIPAQYTKIVMTAPKTKGARMPEEAAPGANTATAKVQKAAVVQAFRAKALQNSIKGLLKGGMTRLLAQSDIVVGLNSSAQARAVFNSKSSALQATGMEVGMMNARNVQVGSIGGGTGTGAGGVGYGKGHHAAVAGQGSAFASLDMGNASVEEGLSKDEVGEVIHRHLSEVRYCYESALLRTPGIEGRLIVNFTIGGTGVVKSSEVKTSTLPDPRLDDCILRRLVTWKFPQTKGGIDVAVSYPFIFKTLGR